MPKLTNFGRLNSGDPFSFPVNPEQSYVRYRDWAIAPTGILRVPGVSLEALVNVLDPVEPPAISSRRHPLRRKFELVILGQLALHPANPAIESQLLVEIGGFESRSPRRSSIIRAAMERLAASGLVAFNPVEPRDQMNRRVERQVFLTGLGLRRALAEGLGA
jgi:hypothetical protein